MTTVLERLQQTFGKHPTFPITYFDDKNRLKDRVAIHDSIHLFIINRDWPVTFKIEDEYSAAIVQAVLRRETKVSRKMHAAAMDETEENVYPDISSIREKTLNCVPQFMQQVLGDWCMAVPERSVDVSDQFIQSHYDTAKVFDALFEQEYGKPFYRVSGEELATMEFEPLKAMFEQARRSVADGPQSPHTSADETEGRRPKFTGRIQRSDWNLMQ